MDAEDPTPKNRRCWNDWSDRYQADHGPQLGERPLAWGVWGIPEAEVGALGALDGRRVLELGCGGAQWAVALAERGVRVVGIDLSERQLAHARRHRAKAGVALPLVQGNAERTPFADGSFDVVFCDHGATSFARPERCVAEAARLLRAGGRFAFNMGSPIHELCWNEAQDRVGTTLQHDYFGMERIEDEREIGYQLPYGAWIRLFRRCGFDVLDLVELRPRPGAVTSYQSFVSHEWARRWPAESLWVLARAEREPEP